MYAFTAVFFALGITLVLYVQGWRLDFEHLRFTKVGAIFIRSFPENAQIFLDETSVKNRSGFFQSGTLVGDLFPKNYTLSLKADGYKNWRGSIGVSPTLVTEVKNAVLVPEHAEIAATSTSNFWILPENILRQKINGELFLGEQKIGRGEAIAWTEDASRILLKNERGEYLWYSPDKNVLLNVSVALREMGFLWNAKVAVDQYDRRHLIVGGPREIYLFDTERVSATRIAQAGNFQFGDGVATSRSYIAWSKWNERTDASTLTVYDKSLERIQKESPALEGRSLNLVWLDDNSLMALQENGVLYLFDRKDGSLRKFADEVRVFVPSGDGASIAAIKNDSLEMSALDGKNYYRFNLPNIGEVRDVIWYKDMSHLFLVYADKTTFLDLNDNPLLNVIEAADSGNVKYGTAKNSLYFLSGSELFSLKFPD